MIPEIDVRSLSAKKQYEGTLAFDFEPEDGSLEIPFVSFSSPVHAELRYEILEDGTVEVRGTVTFSLKGACSRCLENAEQTFTGEVDALFEEGEGDGETYGYHRVVKLSELMHDSLLFALPSRLLCKACIDQEE